MNNFTVFFQFFIECEKVCFQYAWVTSQFPVQTNLVWKTRELGGYGVSGGSQQQMREKFFGRVLGCSSELALLTRGPRVFPCSSLSHFVAAVLKDAVSAYPLSSALAFSQRIGVLATPSFFRQTLCRYRDL